jgi:Uma2 family endonuclease
MIEKRYTTEELEEPGDNIIILGPAELARDRLRIDEGGYYTYTDYLSWDDGMPREVVNKIVFADVLPCAQHETVTRRLHRTIASFLQKNPGAGELLTSPTNLLLPRDSEITDRQISTVVHPDIFVVCDPSKIDKRGCVGPPDFIVEVTSYATRTYHWQVKYFLYQAFRVKEFWIADMQQKTVYAFTLKENRWYGEPTPYVAGQQAPVHTLPGLAMDVSALFED